MKYQRGGFVMGLIVGLLVGLGVALGVALYITKVPVPFINKVPQRTAEQDAAEAEKNRNWDPNGPLYGKNPARPNMVPPTASGATSSAPAGSMTPQETPPVANPVVPSPPVAVPPPPVTPPPTATAPAAKPPAATGRDLNDILSEHSGASAKAGVDPFTYFVQVGAFARPEDAEAQRAKLAMQGIAAKVTEREQGGRTVYRVRVGPFDKKDDAGTVKDKLEGTGMESSLVRVQR